jgi:glycosyltransferase involved in cell wall biosynthesis
VSAARGVLWASRDDTAPHPYLVAACRRAGEPVRDLRWAQAQDGRRPLGRVVQLGGRRAGREHPMTVKLVGPRLLAAFARAPEDVLVVYELGLVGLYAGLAARLRRRRVVSLVEGDYRHLGRTGTAAAKVALRRLAARLVDVFVANNQLARDYLVATLGVPGDRIVVGWWLAGLPPELAARRPPGAGPVPDGVPLFVCAGRLVPPKGVDLLLEAVADYREVHGPCRLWVLGDGPDRAALAALAGRLGIEDCVAFLGPVDHHALKGALEACCALVFPTLQDFIGRVVVEALTTGTPVVLSPLTGAAGTIVHDGVNGIVVDPRDRRALAGALARAADPATQAALRQGVAGANGSLTPAAAGAVVLRAVALARRGRPGR